VSATGWAVLAVAIIVGWTAAAIGVGIIVGRAVRLRDRDARPFDVFTEDDR
jgi:F0F1-type ATP synthase membrane subunit c/vacuolar-type H+-ATPase subunit K